MANYHYSTVPVLSHSGYYVGTLAASDILFSVKEKGINDFREAEQVNIMSLKAERPFHTIGIDKPISELLDLVVNQNFVPVVADRNFFIGIITRKAVINYLVKYLPKK